ncbi:DUF397 domain-containing protein [Micromonospora yasonensis]|uniref:DUF397 domain-containing protein n=1 Tax=Micromonospora yasonensis TaxID=1128667 RepID=UPI002231AA34|nr:DUF397 domain-containing protein [Micromonospora yasonensis]MCW3844996.1 DUF397 domain-containing protein [Micromonospora yasonensis]
MTRPLIAPPAVGRLIEGENGMQWTRPNRCDNSGPNCLEVAHTPDGGRLLRNSQRPDVTIEVDAQEWSTFLDSVRAGQAL